RRREGEGGNARHPSPPHFVRGFHDQIELRLLLVGAERVAVDGRREAALRAEAELLQRYELRGFLDAPLQRVLLLERALLGGDEAEHHRLALRNIAQRLETARTRVVVFEEEAVDRELA